MALVNCKKCGCQMSDKSEACPMCGMPVGMDVVEYNKQMEKQQKEQGQVVPIPNEQPMNVEETATSVSGERTESSTIPAPPVIPSNTTTKKSKTPLIIGIAVAVIAITAVAGFFVIQNQNKTKAENERMMTAPETYPWLHGEWRNGVYGDILDIYSDGTKFIKNGFVIEKEEWNEDERPRTMEELVNDLSYTQKVSFEIVYDKNSEDTPFLSLQFNDPSLEEKTVIRFDTENHLLYYLNLNGKKVFLDKYSDNTFEERWNIELEKANKQLAEDIANHEFDWLYGTWIDFNGQPVVISKDHVYSDNTTQPFKLHYELEDPYSDIMDYGLYLYLCDISVEPSRRVLYWADEFGFYEYQRVSDASEQVSKVYSNAYDGYVNIRQAPLSNAPILGVLHNGPEGAVLLGVEGEWKKIDCNGIVGYVYEKYVQDTPTEVYQYWEVLRKDASVYQFTESDLYSLTAKELTYLRNSVYAKHGYVFHSQELNDYFKLFSWYVPNPNVTESVLNGMEKTNVNFIKNFQERNGKTYKPQ